MTYLDYSATTIVDKRVLDCYKDNYNNYKQNFDDEINDVKKILNTDLDVLFTSGATESNNAAIMGIAGNYKSGRIISTHLEHSSINSTLTYLSNHGFIIDYISLHNGLVSLEELEKLIKPDTILVSIAAVNSETGVLQDIDKIGKFLRNRKIIFHSDMTQSIGKVNISLDNVDLASFDSHKFYGLKGVGVLLKRKDLKLVPIMYGKRLYNYALIKSFVLALSLISKEVSNNYNHVALLNKNLVEFFKNYKYVHVNSNSNCIPHILNISIYCSKPEVFLHMLETYDIYISTKSACSLSNNYSMAVLALTDDLDLAKHSIRISLSYLTTEEDIIYFKKIFDKCYKKCVAIYKKK